MNFPALQRFLRVKFPSEASGTSDSVFEMYLRPPTLCHPASQLGSREEVNNLAGGAWRGLEECWGIRKIFRVTFKSETESFIIKIVCLVYILLSVLEMA